MDLGKGRVVGRARGRPAPTSSAQNLGPGIQPVSQPPINPIGQQAPQPQISSSQHQQVIVPPAQGVVGGRAAVRGNGQMHVGAESVAGALSQLSMGTESTHSSGVGRGDFENKPKARRGMGSTMELVRTRPQHMDNKQGTTGRPVTVITNLFRMIKKSNFSFHHFNVGFNPEVLNPRVRKGMIYQIRANLGTNYLFDGTSLFLPSNLEQPEMEFIVQRTTDGAPVVINIRHVALLPPSSPVCIQVFNIIFKKILEHIGLQMIQRNYYNPKQAMNIERYGLEIWPGYVTSILQYEKETSLIADVSHKILSRETILTRLYAIYERNKSNYQEMAKAELVGTIVLTRYNNKTYKVDDIDWSATPMNLFTMRNKESQTIKDYYKTHYDIDIRDMEQPLIVVMPKKREQRAGQEGPILLVPELCFMTGLSESARKDFNMMKELATRTRIGPMDRVKTLRGFLNQIKTNAAATKEFANWNMELDSDLMQIAARVLNPEKINLGSNRSNIKEVMYKPDTAEWSQEMKMHKLLECVQIKNWVYVYTSQNETDANNFGQTLISSARDLGMNISDQCTHCCLRDGQAASYMKALKENCNSQTQFVMCLLPSARKDIYDSIKKHLCCDMPIPSQVMLAKTISKPQMLRSVATKVAIQINTKMGMQSWAVDIPLKNTMVVGIDVYHDSLKKMKSFMGVVATLNNNYTNYYTYVNSQSNVEELGRGLTIGIHNCLKKYFDVNQTLPAKIVIYRDGVGDGQLAMVVNYEVEQIYKAFQQQGEGYKPQLAVVVVQKRVNSRFFIGDGPNIKNPLPGTLIDSGATRPEWYDFFIVSQSVRQGSVTPTHYNVIKDDTNLKPDQMQRLTYKLCHLYFNWQGTIRVPAPCQYAHKVAFLVGQSLHTPPNQALSDKLYYL